MNQQSAQIKPETQILLQKQYQAAIAAMLKSAPAQFAKGYISPPDANNSNDAFQSGQAIALSPSIAGVGDDVLRMALAVADKARPVDPTILIQAQKLSVNEQKKRHSKK